MKVHNVTHTHRPSYWRTGRYTLILSLSLSFFVSAWLLEYLYFFLSVYLLSKVLKQDCIPTNQWLRHHSDKLYVLLITNLSMIIFKFRHTYWKIRIKRKLKASNKNINFWSPAAVRIINFVSATADLHSKKDFVNPVIIAR